MRTKLLVACSDMESALALCAKLTRAECDRIAAQATDLVRVVSRAAELRPDVLLLEHALAAEAKSWQIVGRLRQLNGSMRFLLLCDAYTHLMIVGFVRHGVHGCLLKEGDPSLIAKAINAVVAGESWFGRTALLQALRSQIATEDAGDSEWPEEHESLTQREKEILRLIGDALSNKEIARRLNISDQTVKTHLHHIYVKLNQSGRYKAFLSKVAVAANQYPAGFAGPPQ